MHAQEHTCELLAIMVHLQRCHASKESVIPTCKVFWAPAGLGFLARSARLPALCNKMAMIAAYMCLVRDLRLMSRCWLLSNLQCLGRIDGVGRPIALQRTSRWHGILGSKCSFLAWCMMTFMCKFSCWHHTCCLAMCQATGVPCSTCRRHCGASFLWQHLAAD